MIDNVMINETLAKGFVQRFGALRRLGLEVRMYKFSTLFIRIPNAQISTEAQLLQNPCYLPFFFRLSFYSTGYCPTASTPLSENFNISVVIG